jgi:hypothetical protein
VSSSSGYAVTLRHSVGSRASCRKLKPHKLIVSAGCTILALSSCVLMSLQANFLRINIYLTQKIDEDMMWNIAVNDAGAPYDPLTLLRTRTLFGRPDWKSIYGRLRMAIENGQYLPGTNSQLRSTVGVCIPRILDADILLTGTLRHTSVARLPLRELSRRLASRIQTRLSTSRLPR